MVRELLVPFVLALGCVAQPGMPLGTRLEGGRATPLGERGTKAVVLFFVASDCPVSNREFPEMVRLRKMFSAQGVRFWFVYPNVTEKVDEVQMHQAAYDGGGGAETLVDPEGKLVRLSGVKVTPEAAILVPAGDGWKAVYHGRIDDRFVHLGVRRPAATEFFVERGLRQVLSGEAVTGDTGTPVGCAIMTRAVMGR